MADYELYHYGVLGMKWGVRRGKTSRAYAKASKKLNKLNNRVSDSEAEMNKRTAKADKSLASRFASEKRQNKKLNKARVAAADYRSAVRKANKWYKAMESTFENTDISLTTEQVRLGKKYAKTLRTDSLIRY